jgi:putative oxidoreductase
MSYEVGTAESGCRSADPARLRPVPLRALVEIADRWMELARRRATLVLRMALGIVFVWFGFLKLVGASPASGMIRDLLTATVPFVPVEPAVVLLGVIEVVIGLGFLTWIAPRLTLLLFVPQMVSTFATLLFLPGSMFQRGDPLLLSMSGEFVVKNLILLAAGVAVLAGVPTKAQQSTQ